MLRRLSACQPPHWMHCGLPKKTASAKPAILIASDGEMVSAEHPASGDTLHCKFSEIGDNFGFFLPAAGKERYRAVEENPIDAKAAGKMAKLYDALIKTNPDWGNFDRRREMNQLMVRLVFCMFAEDVGIFSDNQFSRLVFSHAGNNGEEAREAIMAVFTALNQPTKNVVICQLGRLNWNTLTVGCSPAISMHRILISRHSAICVMHAISIGAVSTLIFSDP